MSNKKSFIYYKRVYYYKILLYQIEIKTIIVIKIFFKIIHKRILCAYLTLNIIPIMYEIEAYSHNIEV